MTYIFAKALSMEDFATYRNAWSNKESVLRESVELMHFV